jgi:tetratricopeptide (TPR) repeat protein
LHRTVAIVESTRPDLREPVRRMSKGSTFEHALRAFGRARFEEAISLFTQAADEGDRAADAVSKRGVCRLRLGDRGTAARDFNAALQIDPRCVAALTNLGNLALEADQRDVARARYEAALHIDETYAPAHHNYAVLLHREGRIAESVRELRLAAKYENRGKLTFLEWLSGKRK